MHAGTALNARPRVTVVLPTLNERSFIRDCLDSLLSQDYVNLLEILVVDGGSVDGTVGIAQMAGLPVALVENPRVSAAAAMNIGIAVARGEIIVRADAHTRYEQDYVRRCVEVLLETGADNVGGPMRPVGTTSFGRAVAAVTSSPYGIGPGRFHYSDRREEVDTVYLGCWHRAVLVASGGFDEVNLQWAAEDQELNFRIRLAGGRVVIDPGIRSYYFPRETIRALARQYANYGVAKASTLAKHRMLPSWRPLAPAGLVAATAAVAVVGHGWRRVLPPLLHGAACAVIGVRLGRDPGVAPHRATLAMAVCHWSYGVGFWAGLTRIARGAGFDQRPSGGRR